MDVAGMRARLAFTQTLEADLQIGRQAIETSGRNPQSSAGIPGKTKSGRKLGNTNGCLHHAYLGTYSP
jgi:hypothetical protein